MFGVRYKPRHQCGSQISYLTRAFVSEPRDALYSQPRYLACWFGWHNSLCVCRHPHYRKRYGRVR